MPYDVAELRTHFPSLASGTAHFDGPGGTQTPREVAAAIATTLSAPLSNRGSTGASEANADAAVNRFRAAGSDLLGVPASGIVHGRSATQLTYDFSRALAKQWTPGDRVVVSRLRHDANVRPWLQAAGAAGARLGAAGAALISLSACRSVAVLAHDGAQHVQLACDFAGVLRKLHF